MNDENKAIIIIVLVFWIGFCVLMFVKEPESSLSEKAVFCIMTLWIFIRMARYKGRCRPKSVYAIRILWLPMAVLFAYLALTGQF